MDKQNEREYAIGRSESMEEYEKYQIWPELAEKNPLAIFAEDDPFVRAIDEEGIGPVDEGKKTLMQGEDQMVYSEKLGGNKKIPYTVSDTGKRQGIGKVRPQRIAHSHTRIPHADANKSEGEILLDAMLNNVWAKINDWRDSRRQAKIRAEQEATQGNLIPNQKGGILPGKEVQDPLLSQEKFKDVMHRLQQAGVDMQKLYESGDMERLLFGRMTKDTYTMKPQGSNVEREGQLFVDEQGQLHCAMKKNSNSVLPELSEKQNEWLKQRGYVVTETHLIKRDEKSLRIRKIPLSSIRLQEVYKGHRFTEEERASLFQGEKIRIAITKDGKQKSTFVSYNPTNNQVQHHYAKDLVPRRIAGVDLMEKERNRLAKGQPVTRHDLIDQQGQRYSGTVFLNDKGKIQLSNGQVRADQRVYPTKQYEQQVLANNKGIGLQSEESVQALKSGETLTGRRERTETTKKKQSVIEKITKKVKRQKRVL